MYPLYEHATNVFCDSDFVLCMSLSFVISLLPFVLNLFSNQLLCGVEVTVSTLISMVTVMTYDTTLGSSLCRFIFQETMLVVASP